MDNTVILGGGMAGFGAAHRFNSAGVDSVLFEKESRHGGHAVSFNVKGFVFDDGPHISFTKNEYIMELFANSIDNQYESLQARVNNYWKGHWIKHPAVCNLNGLPQELVVDVLEDFLEAQQAKDGNVNNYEDWLIAGYGKKFAKAFPMQYGKKFHTTTADNMTTEWAGPRVYRPNLREVLQGALSNNTSNVHYITDFRYPSKGGFISYLNGFLKCTNIQLNHKLVGLDPNKHELYFANGKVIPYSHVVSSLPLPELVPMIEDVPVDVIEAAEKLACSMCVLVTLGIDREDISEAHWSYFYDDDFFFTRLSFPHMQSLHNAPNGMGSIQAEVYYSDKYRPLDRSPQECIDPVVSDLLRCGLIRENDNILFKHAKIIPYANVIFDLDRTEALKTVHGYLDEIKVAYCGRYGEWGYLWSDESFVSGEKAAQKILDNRLVMPKGV